MTVPGSVLSAYGWADLDVSALGSGLINDTFLVSRDGAPVAVLQRLHPVFAGEVNVDLDAVTTHLAAKGLPTPRLLRTLQGALWIDADRPWRALSFVDGRCIERVESPAQAAAAGALVGRFHAALSDFRYDYAHVRAGVHDTAAHLAKLHALRTRGGQGDALADDILAFAADLPELAELPLRHCHGDLKISNLLFRGEVGHCLIDLDTCGLQSLAYELGDAMRSWCNPAGEDVAAPVIDVDIFRAGMVGYRSTAPASSEELRSVVDGLETVCCELAARFCADVYEDRYFGWDRARFASRGEHNTVRARGQLSLARSVRAHRRELQDALTGRG